MTEESAQPNRGGRPAGSTTGQKKLRTLRMGPIWDRSQQLATELAALNGTLNAKGEGNVTAYVEEALRRENARIERLLARESQPDAAE